MEFINSGPAYIRGWWQRWGGGDTQIVEFRVTMTFTCTHKGPIFNHKTQIDVDQQWEPYQIPTAKLEPSIGTNLPVVDLHCRKKALWKSRSVDISKYIYSMLYTYIHMLATKYTTVDYQGISSEAPYNYKSTTTLPMTISMVITYSTIQVHSQALVKDYYDECMLL